uniref:DDE-1 domain-containing protein n=1 Tax=Amphimedon queenslandica TaxID=400682 RepID=A0A1X7TZ62_AMPQE
MNREKEKIIPITKSDDKRQITAVLAISITGEHLPPQIIYEGKTTPCHPNVTFPKDWDVWHSPNHWSNEITMKRYIEKVIVPFVSQKRESLKLQNDCPALAIFDSFKGQTTLGIFSLLESNNIIPIKVPANCTDKLQPLDVSINKPFVTIIDKRALMADFKIDHYNGKYQPVSALLDNHCF